MLPFLKLIGAVDGNGVLPFARNFEIPNSLIATINTVLCRQQLIIVMERTATTRKNHKNQMKTMREQVCQAVLQRLRLHFQERLEKISVLDGDAEGGEKQTRTRAASMTWSSHQK